MRLSEFIIGVGRTIAYYPNLKNVTGSTTATILLCQLIYWIDKTNDGWIYKDSMELEEETGLSYYEQQTARKALIDLGIIEEQYKRLDHKISFRLHLDVLNDLWDDYYNPNKPREPKPAQNKKGDLMDGILAYGMESPGVKKENVKNEIREKLESQLHVNLGALKWEKFIDYVYSRQVRHNEPVDKFILWIKEEMKDGFKSTYWTPEKLTMLYPQAFVEDTSQKEFLPKPVKIEEEDDNVPMPEYAKNKKNLY